MSAGPALLAARTPRGRRLRALVATLANARDPIRDRAELIDTVRDMIAVAIDFDLDFACVLAGDYDSAIEAAVDDVLSASAARSLFGDENGRGIR